MFGKTGIKNQKYYRRKILFLILLLICVFASLRYISIQVMELSERQCVNRLMENTDHFCTVLNQNIEDARDHLESLADVSGENINDKDKLQEMLQAFAVYGSLCRLEILFPDNTLMMSGVKEIVPTSLNFEEEAAKGSIISSRMKDPLDGRKDIFKIAIPIKDENKTHGILYGIMDIELLTKALDLSFYEGKADYFVIEQYNGELVLDTRTDNLSDENEKFRVSEQEQLYEAVLGIKKDLRIGKESYAKLYAKKTGEYIFLGYGNVGIKDWRGMISVPENVAFSYADETMLALRGSMVLVFLSVFLFMAFSLRQELKEIKKNQFVMQMQSLLMQAQRTEQAFEQALLTVKDKFLGEIIFLTNFNESTEKLLVMGNTSIEEEIRDCSKEFIREMTAYAKQSQKGEILSPGSVMARNCPFTTGLCMKYHMDNMIFLPMYTPDGEVSDIMGIMGAKSVSYSLELLEDLSVDFVLTMHDLKYLREIEKASMEDALTGTMNRASYHEKKAMIKKNPPDTLGCIYIDVDNLHMINNFYGHDMGDAMLRCICSTLAEQFGVRNVYRIGGDEFVIFKEHISEVELIEKMEKANEYIIEDDYHVSYGIEWSASPFDLEKMIKSAEDKMYDAKKQYHRNS